MQYALVENDRREPFKGGKGVCPICGSDMNAKCGPRVMHHWSHKPDRNCDPWWENETEWHRSWKELYPVDCREISHTSNEGEIHRADVKTKNGIIIEFQHSSISDRERISRECFYKNLVWVVDGIGFKQNFFIYHMLPNPNSDLAKDLVWQKTSHKQTGFLSGAFFRWSEGFSNEPNQLFQIHSIGEIEKEIEQFPSDYYQFDWVRPHKTWFESTCPVYIDLGENLLAKLDFYGKQKLPVVRLISKKKFLYDSLYELKAVNIAARFFQISAEARKEINEKTKI